MTLPFGDAAGLVEPVVVHLPGHSYTCRLLSHTRERYASETVRQTRRYTMSASQAAATNDLLDELLPAASH